MPDTRDLARSRPRRVHGDARAEYLSPRHGDARAPVTDRIVVVGAVFLLVLISVIPWRSESIYSGGLDAVVVAKAAIALVAATVTLLLVLRTRERVPVGVGPAVIICFTLALSVLGAIVAGDGQAMSTIVLVVRVVLIMVTILMLLTCVTWSVAIGCLLAAMGVLATVAAVTGVPRFLATGRLGGGMPEIHPNELAGLALIPLVGVTVAILHNGARVWSLGAMVVLLPILIATGSRTAIGTLAIGVGAALLVNGIRQRGSLIAVLAALPLGYAIVAFSDVLGDLATRGGATDVTSTLGSRFDAWSVVWAWDWGAWEKWIGVGLSVKRVAVDIKFRDTQVLDSSWASLLAQTGIIGTALIALLVAASVIAAVRSRRRRWLLLPLVAVIVPRSVTESGLIDSHTAFVLFFTVASLLSGRSEHADERSPELLSDGGFSRREHAPLF